ncbi:MAG TPA: hypothetical protein VF591_05995 [Pyrinomonadaceae bacterium]|jgi:hypothetical protein
MKEGFDREIDSLLRRRARGTAESRSWGDGAGDGAHGAHLDADELGAFAEGALPAPARLAAASHLADCDRCRGVVVGLARVEGVEREVKQHAAATTASAESARPSAWRALVASLFAPRVMRFAVPVLALSLVGVVSYVALRSGDGGALRAARDGRRQSGTLQSAPSAPAASNTGTTASNPELTEAQNGNAAPREATAAGVQPGEPKGHGGVEARPAEAYADRPDREVAQPSVAAQPPPPPAAAATEGPVELSKSAPKPVAAEEGEVARVDSKEKSENRDKSARASETADEVVANDAPVQRRAQPRVNQVQMPDGSDARNNQKRSADNNATGVYGGGSAGTAAAPRESERAGSRSEAQGRARASRQAEKKADEDEVARVGDTRAAAGHRFRREGSAWVDVNYKPSMPSTGVRRGTDSFRALVADVPEVGRVAAAIGGEVVVVVGGRAYRIR